MQHFWLVSLVGLLAFWPFSGNAAAAPIRPGLWEMQVQAEMVGLPLKLPVQTVRHCITRAEIEKNNGIPKPPQDKNLKCKLTQISHSKNMIQWKMSCTGKSTLLMQGTTRFQSRTAYHALIHVKGVVQGRKLDMTQNVSARRVGACKP